MKKQWYVADFETTSYKTYQEKGYTKVWLYAIANSNIEIETYGDSIENFMQWCRQNSGAIVYFHNLKFDGTFILDYLLRQGYEYKPKLKAKDNKSYNALIGEEGQYYQIRINFRSQQYIIIRDSLKIIPRKVKELAKDFNMTIQKEKIDYENYTIDRNTLKYVFNDVLIVAKALKYFIDEGFTKMTIGGNAYQAFKDMQPYINSYYPELSDVWLEDYRNAYRGGRVQVSPHYQGKILENVYRYDINSMYPHCLRNCPMPYGQPIKINKPKQYKFELYKVEISFKLKKGHLPSLLKSGSLFGNENSYYINSDDIITLFISNIDLDIMYRHYNISYLQFIEMWGFQTNNDTFKQFVDTYYKKKATSKDGIRLVYKYILNNLYGKFGSKNKGYHKIPKLEDNILCYQKSDIEDMTKYYLPVAIAVTSYAHLLLDDAIQYAGDNFVYCDTDSVHTLKPLPKEMINNTELGKFKLEAIESKSKYLRQKCYVYKEEDCYTITCAGLPDDLKKYLIDKYQDKIFDIFNYGLQIDANYEDITIDILKKRPVLVPGGTVLVPTSFTLKGVVK